MDDRDIFIYTSRGTYQYDADFDQYRRVRTEPLSHREQFGWLYVCLFLFIIAVVLSR